MPPIVRFHCPFAGLSGCRDGGGNGLARTSLITHLRDRHFIGEALAITKHSLVSDLVIFERAEVTLKRMGLCYVGFVSKRTLSGLSVVMVGGPISCHRLIVVMVLFGLCCMILPNPWFFLM